MAETEKVTPNPEASKPAAKAAVDATKYVRRQLLRPVWPQRFHRRRSTGGGGALCGPW
jgi:hypothetical protein